MTPSLEGTLPKTNSSHLKRWWEDDRFHFGKAYFQVRTVIFWEGKLTAGNPPNMELWKINVDPFRISFLDKHLRRESKEKPTKKISNLSSDRFTLAILLLYGGIILPSKKRDYFISHETNPYTPISLSMECHE